MSAPPLSDDRLAPAPPLPDDKNTGSFDDLGKEFPTAVTIDNNNNNNNNNSNNNNHHAPIVGLQVADINWSREQDNRLRGLRAQLDRDGALPRDLEPEYLALEKQFDVFEREGMRRLMEGMTPEQHASSAGSSGGALASPGLGGKSGSGGFLTSASDFFGKTANFVSQSASRLKPHVEEAGRGAWFWSSLAVGAGAPGFIGRKLGLTDRFDHWNWIIPYVSTNRSGGLLLGAIPVLTEVMGSGNHLKSLHDEVRQFGTEMGMVVSIVLPSELDGFGIGVVKFAHHEDWIREFGPDFVCRLLPIQDNTANGFSYELVMKTLTEMNEVMVTGKCVYVHCAKGVGRSLTLVVCYLIVFLGKNPDEAIAHAKACRHQIAPNKVQMDFIRTFYAMHRHHEEEMEKERKRKYSVLPTIDLNALLREQKENERDSQNGKESDNDRISQNNNNSNNGAAATANNNNHDQISHHQSPAAVVNSLESIDTSPNFYINKNDDATAKNNCNDDDTSNRQQQNENNNNNDNNNSASSEANTRDGNAQKNASNALDDIFGI